MSVNQVRGTPGLLLLIFASALLLVAASGWEQRRQKRDRVSVINHTQDGGDRTSR